MALNEVIMGPLPGFYPSQKGISGALIEVAEMAEMTDPDPWDDP